MSDLTNRKLWRKAGEGDLDAARAYVRALERERGDLAPETLVSREPLVASAPREPVSYDYGCPNCSSYVCGGLCVFRAFEERWG